MTTERNVYLENIPMDAAWVRLLEALHEHDKAGPVPAEIVPLRQACGRVTAAAVWAKRSTPHYHAAAMDGYAVQASDTREATETRPLTLAAAQVTPVNTGDPLPADANAVIMIEHVQEDDGAITIVDPVAPWQHVRMMGEDMIATELILPEGHVIRPVDLGALAGCGHHTVAVRRKPRVVIIPTGSELVSTDVEPEAGQITEFNSLVLTAQLEENGGEVEILPITPDQPAQLAAALDTALAGAPDLVLMLSGSSAGSRDYTASMIQERGTLLVHGIAVRPGHPVIIGMAESIPVIGVPGYPVSAALTGELLIQRLIAHWQGSPAPTLTQPRTQAILTRKLVSPAGDDDYVRVTLAQVGERLLATPLNRGAGVITSLVRADGLAHIPRFSEGAAMGDSIEVLLYRTQHAIKQTVFTMGSHDPMLDLLGQHLAQDFAGFRLASANVGSMGGLVALRRDEAHMAGMHLLDGESGEYNLPYIAKQLPKTPVIVVTFAHREQGLIVAKDNPHNISGIDDLPDYRYVNRQRGAGTRLLLDYELQQRNLDPASIAGYEREEYTHLAVAAAVATGIADCGLGVRSAALALDLDFVTVGWERYDLVIPTAYHELAGVQHLLTTLRSDRFKQALAQQAGYDTRETGEVQHG